MLSETHLPIALPIQLQINGEPQTCPAGLTLLALLDHLRTHPRLVVVEYNGEILPRQAWETTQISPGDRLEIVTIVGGG